MSETAARERTYTTDDKSGWGDGPWQEEPDKVQFVDEATGLPCLIVRNRGGALCGYVGVPEGHPWFERDYDDVTVDGEYVEVHGGLTYAARCQEEAAEEEGICHVPEPGEPERWWLGFDCAHLMDISPAHDARDRERGWDPLNDPMASYRTVEYVRSECARLAAQAVAAA